MKSHFALYFFVTLFALQAWSVAFDENDPLLVESQLQPHSWSGGQSGQLTLKLKLPPGYHVYEEQLKINILEPDGFKQGKVSLDGVKEWFDKNSKRNRRGVENKSQMKIQLEAPMTFQNTHSQMKFDLTYQACSETFCLFPLTKTISVPIELIGPFSQTPAQIQPQLIPGSSAPSSEVRNSVSFFSADQLSQWLGKSWIMALLFVFLAGILTSFTPCIFPMIPITLAILAKDSEKRSRVQNFLLSIFYVQGIAFTYSILGLIAASSGSLFGSGLGNPIVLSFICIIFLIMSLSMYGYFEIQVPSFLRNNLGQGTKKTGYFGSFLSGLFAGIVASPCVGPVLVGILAFVATQKSHLFGFLLLYSYAMGLGLIFLFLGAFTELTRKLPRSGPWMESIKFLLGSLMLGAFFYYLALLLPERWHDGFLGLGLIIVASLAGAFNPTKGEHPVLKLRKGFLQAILFVGFSYLAISIFNLRPIISGPYAISEDLTLPQWKPYAEAEYKTALESRKPIIIDFYADWCAACHELERHTFSSSKFKALADQFILLRFDATKNSELLRVLKSKYKIQGLPTVIFYTPNGVWQDSLTLTEFEGPDRFVKRMQKALGN
ncbi:MAG: cytochrome c biogenesis protein CcdA [Bdellovibrionota bacterium]